MTSTVKLGRDALIFDFPYIRSQIDEIKQIEGARWDPVARVWEVPIRQVAAGRDFAARHGFEIAEDLARLEVPQHLVGVRRIEFGEFLDIYFPYDEAMVSKARKIPGARWVKKRKCWRAPRSSAAAVVEFAEQFSLHVPEELTTHQSEEAARQSRLREMSRAEESDFDVPGLSGTLKPFQRAGVEYVMETRRSFIADEMGLGKTMQAIAAIEAAEALPAVVVCPPTLTLNWAAEITKWTQRSVSVVQGRKVFPEPADVVVVGWSNVKAWQEELIEIGPRAFIADESQFAKSKKAQRTQAAIEVAKAVPADGLVLCLSGTPIVNRPKEFASQLAILGRLDEFGGEWPFYIRYCGAFKDQWGQWHLDGKSNLDELNDRLRGICYVRRTKAQVLSELDPKEYTVTRVEGDPRVMKEYRKAEDDIIEYVQRRAEEVARELGENPRSARVIAKIKAEAATQLVEMANLRRLAGLAKLPAVDELIEAHIESGQKVVVAAHHRDVVDAVATAHGDLRIWGGQKTSEVEEHKAKFQALPVEDAPVIVLSIQAAKAGHTLTAAQDVMFVEFPFTPGDFDQVSDRLHRIGQEGSVMVNSIICADTIDEDFYSLIGEKRKVVDAATEGGEAAQLSLTGELLAGLLSRRG